MKLNKNFKKLLIVGGLVVVLLGISVVVKPGIFMDFGMWLTASMKHRDAANEKPAYTLNAQQFSNAFKSDTSALKTYVDKAVLLNGQVTAIDGIHVSLGNVVCAVDSTQIDKVSKLKTGDSVKIQGRVSTYNDLMDEIDMDQCVLK